MQNLALLVLLISIVCFFIGIIKPNSFNSIFKRNVTRKFTSIFFSALTVISFIVFGVSSDNRKGDEIIPEKQITPEQNLTTAPISEEDRIKEIIKNELDGENNNDKPYLGNIDFFMDKGEAAIVINYNADENITNNLTKVSMNMKMSNLYYKLYQSGLPIKSIRICGYLTLTDKYGNKSDDVVYTTVLNKDESSKVNWTNDESQIKNIILPQVWTTLFIHPALTDN